MTTPPVCRGPRQPTAASTLCVRASENCSYYATRTRARNRAREAGRMTATPWRRSPRATRRRPSPPSSSTAGPRPLEPRAPHERRALRRVAEAGAMRVRGPWARCQRVAPRICESLRATWVLAPVGYIPADPASLSALRKDSERRTG
jgi:hypothetical protein